MSWEDRNDDLTLRIKDDLPINTDDYATYLRAQQLVSNRHSKDRLVELVNHLLVRQAK